MQQSSVLDAIFHRRSIRDFTAEPVTEELLREVIRAGIWAPSGLNNQPWRFRIIQDAELKTALAEQTTYSHIILAAPALIAIYLDNAAIYDPVKDHQAAGACIQNMLLAIEALGLAGVWLGQILKNKLMVNSILSVSNQFDLMAIIAIGYAKHHNQSSSRKPLEQFLI
ncbi:MAG: nitroreductase [Proteobacteria bacterium]|nr:nitroreductase family protein [Desulfobulbaceae bacterium]MBU4153837.1 nitroreductase [Pseudomonadota bacterium]MDP2106398.1 nitroreductase [Desulfobulbaceae bacterium]